jgi:hypothetical protein
MHGSVACAMRLPGTNVRLYDDIRECRSKYPSTHRLWTKDRGRLQPECARPCCHESSDSIRGLAAKKVGQGRSLRPVACQQIPNEARRHLQGFCVTDDVALPEGRDRSTFETERADQGGFEALLAEEGLSNAGRLKTSRKVAG